MHCRIVRAWHRRPHCELSQSRKYAFTDLKEVQIWMDAMRIWKWCLNHLGTIPSYAQDHHIHICTGQNMNPIDIKCTVYARLLTAVAHAMRCTIGAGNISVGRLQIFSQGSRCCQRLLGLIQSLIKILQMKMKCLRIVVN